MEFKFSDELPVSDNSTGDMAGSIPVRQHRNGSVEDVGALRAQRDWRQFVGPLHDFKGGMSGKYGLMQVAVPECRPERLEVLAYASEIGFLYDDCTELLSGNEVSKANDDMQAAFTEGVRSGSIGSGSHGLKALQANLFREMCAIDQPRAMVAFKVWIEFLEQSAGRQHDIVHSSFDDYLKYRLLDVGEMFWFGLVTFGMALTISETELALIRRLTRPCWIVLALQNDLCSYSKELDAAQLKGTIHVVNALWFLMKDHDVDLDQAKGLIMDQIEVNVVAFQKNIAACQNDTRLSKDAKIYLESLLYTISGDAAWSLVTPRYNSDKTYNEVQLSMVEDRCEMLDTPAEVVTRDWLVRTSPEQRTAKKPLDAMLLSR